MSPEPTQPPQGTSPIALVAMLTGILGLAFGAMGCFLWPMMFVSAALSLIGIIMGYVELQNINAGKSPESNRIYAQTGMGTGAGGCTIGCLYALLVGLLLGLYVAFVLFYVVVVAIMVGAGQM